MKFVRSWAALALAFLLPCAALAQAPVGKSIQAPSGYLPASAIYCDDGTGHAALCNFGTGGGSGGGGGTSAAVSRISYLATASGTGFSAGDQLERIVTTSPTTGGIIATYWINVSAGGLLTTAPAAANITLKPETITNTTFTVTQGTSPWIVSGQVADGIAPVNPAVHVAGVDGAGLKRTLLTDAAGRLTIILPQLAATSRSGLFGTTAVQLMPANAARHFIQVQVQNTATCYMNGSATATADQNSLLLPGGGQLFESTSHVGTSAISIICSAASTPVYAREG